MVYWFPRGWRRNVSDVSSFNKTLFIPFIQIAMNESIANFCIRALISYTQIKRDQKSPIIHDMPNVDCELNDKYTICHRTNIPDIYNSPRASVCFSSHASYLLHLVLNVDCWLIVFLYDSKVQQQQILLIYYYVSPIDDNVTLIVFSHNATRLSRQIKSFGIHSELRENHLFYCHLKQYRAEVNCCIYLVVLFAGMVCGSACKLMSTTLIYPQYFNGWYIEYDVRLHYTD